MRTLANAANVYGWDAQWEKSLEHGARAIELADDVDETITELRAQLWASISLTALGQLKESNEHIARVISLADALRDRYWAVQSSVCEASS